MLKHDWTGDISGQVLDEADLPIEPAKVLVVVKTWPDKSYFQRSYVAVCDKQGRFMVSDVYPVDENYEVLITAVAGNHVLVSTYYDERLGILPPCRLQLILPQASCFK